MLLTENKEYIDFIDEFIKSEEFIIFKKEIEKELCITGLAYKINIEDLARSCEGYVEMERKASTIFSKEYSDVEEIIFYDESIEKYIKNKFSRLEYNEVVFKEIIKVYLKFILVHELVHIHQFKRGKLTKEIVNKEKRLPYKDRTLEKEADKNAKSIISSLGRLEEQLVESFSKSSIDNSDIEKILDNFNKV